MNQINSEGRIKQYVITLSPKEVVGLANQVKVGTAVVDRKCPNGDYHHEFVLDLQPTENSGEYMITTENYGVAH